MSFKYIESIKQIYPDLTIENYYPNEIGQNNDVLIVNNSLVFRFPKYKQGIIQLKKETELLEYINEIITMPIPHPTYQSFETSKPGEVFTGYKLIAGVPLWKDSLQNIKNEELLKGLASQLVTFLMELHSISKEKAKNDLNLNDNNPTAEMSDLFNRIQNKLFPFIRGEAQEEINQAFESFLNGKAALNLKTVLIHGDFGASNILWKPKSRSISGIIDFGGSGIGDPAYDFAGILSSYGEKFFDMCIGRYPNGNEISERVKFYKSTFALQEALHGIENNDQQAFENGIKDYR
ncbi:phosphotransferase family protein [Oceanobacillus sojae]|uniref:6'-aminoglycoside N-acetyltransferase n=1 Tax=Oceanobacillus sojae TaxID=582851 RepID=A0A511ZEW0_9BACI|nr:aminoglycoside phosphotransferase family protein [Oceanobacillus sojae]GEN85941.1 6'-aminoglycoside N-acetyltransferase [Oceanobacillus sojae]